jgi:lipopolysaccharide heptosyltransferase II
VSDFDPSAIARVLVRAPNWLGDAVMALPALAAVRRTFPRSTLAVAAPSSVAPIFEETVSAAPDEVLAVERKNEGALIRAGRFDLAILLPNSFRSAWVVKRAGVPHRWGIASNGRGWLLTRKVRRPQKGRHQSARYLDLMDALGVSGTDDLPRVAVSDATRRRAQELLARHGIDASTTLVGLAPGAAYGHAKRWPPRRMAELAGRLGERGAICMLVGAGGDRDAGREIESALPASARIVNLIGRTDLRLLTGVLERCQTFVSNDSGAMHLAAAVGVPVVAIFGPTDERVTAPLGDREIIIEQVFCRPCMLRDCPIDHRCMKRITVDRVLAAAASRLPAPGPRPNGSVTARSLP